MTAADTNECQLFTYSGDDSHIVYKNLCSAPNDNNEIDGYIAYLRQSISAMWQKFKPLADSHFMTEFPRMPDQRYWEMYLGSCLVNREFSVASTDKGPDFCIDNGDRKIWIEAMTASLGDDGNPNKVPEPEIGTASAVPRDKMILRFHNSIDAKEKVFKKYRHQGIVKADDINIIAVSRGELRRAGPDGDTLPYILSSVFPVGHQYITFDTKTGETLETGRHYQSEICKANGASVGTEFFIDQAHEDISAIIYSSADIGNIPKVWGSDIIVIHNPLTKNPLPRGLQKFPLEYWVEKDEDCWLIKHERFPAVAA